MLDLLLLAAHLHTYTVQPGDTLSGISERVYGDASRWPQLCRRNRIRNCDLIFPDQVLRLDLPGRTVRVSARDGRRVLSGTLDCHGLESLWEYAGGAPWAAFTAAEIAMAESSGEQYATGPYGERGYWQINTDHGYLSTYDAYGNARAAVIISDDGRNWYPWTTFVTGAYRGRCLPFACPVTVGAHLVSD